MGQNGRSPGRPRDKRVDDALLQAGLEVFMSSGYPAATLTEIARRANVSKPAIYRRWPTKFDMAMETIVIVNRPEPIPNTGSIRDDLVTFLRFRIRTFRTPFFSRLMMPMILESVADPKLAKRVNTRFRDYRHALDGRIRTAIDAGQLRPDTDPTRFLDLLVGTVMLPLLFSQELPKEAEARWIVDQVLEGFATKRRKAGKAAPRS